MTMKEKRIFTRFGFNLFKAENALPKSKVITEFENWIYELNVNERIYIYRGISYRVYLPMELSYLPEKTVHRKAY